MEPSDASHASQQASPPNSFSGAHDFRMEGANFNNANTINTVYNHYYGHPNMYGINRSSLPNLPAMNQPQITLSPPPWRMGITQLFRTWRTKKTQEPSPQITPENTPVPQHAMQLKLKVQPGVYVIRNLQTNEYLNPQGGYAIAGRKVFLQSWVPQESLKWLVFYNPLRGTYYIINSQTASGRYYYMLPGLPQNRGQPPQLELNDSPFEWAISEAPDGNGFFLAKPDDSNQVAEADLEKPGILLNDLVLSKAEKRQIWAFELPQLDKRPKIQPGTYIIRNLQTSKYLNPEKGYAAAGNKVSVQPWAIQGSFKWIVDFNPMVGTYYIKNFVTSYYLRPCVTESRGQSPQLELNDTPFEWVIGDTPNGNGFFIVKGDEQDQVAEVEAEGSATLLNDLDLSRAEKRQIWTFELS